MARTGPLVAIALLLAAVGAATAVVLLHGEAAPPELLAHARAAADERPPEAPAALEAASPSRTLDELLEPPAPAESPDAGAAPLAVDDEEEMELFLEFKPYRSQVDQLRRMGEAARNDFARLLSFGLATKELKDPRLREFVEKRMARSERRWNAALTRMYAAKETALTEKARDVAVGVRPDDAGSDLPSALARSRVTTRDGTVVRVVVREGDCPELDRARAAYEKIRDRRADVVLAIFDLVLATER